MAVPAEGKVISVVEPHSCDEKTVQAIDEVVEDSMFGDGKDTQVHLTPLGEIQEMEVKKTEKTKVNELFDSFPFVKKLNKDVKEHEVPESPGDKRDKKHLREELVTSSAPQSILNRAQDETGKTTPEHEM